MIPNPIRKVLSTFQSCEARALLMGGQACVFYAGSNLQGDAPPWAKSVRPGDGSRVLHGALDTLNKPRAAPFHFSSERP